MYRNCHFRAVVHTVVPLYSVSKTYTVIIHYFIILIIPLVPQRSCVLLVNVSHLFHYIKEHQLLGEGLLIYDLMRLKLDPLWFRPAIACRMIHINARSKDIKDGDICGGTSLTDSQKIAIFAELTNGPLPVTPCSECYNQNSMFPVCRLVPDHIYGQYACTNCHWANRAELCTHCGTPVLIFI